jgi:AcrR family transcriptional regulator
VLDERVTIVENRDGRVTRGARNRQAIIDALLACYEDGLLRPSIDEVARRAGVSPRSVHNHFSDAEALRAEVAQRQWERHFTMRPHIDPEAPRAERVDAIVTWRTELFEAISPVRRAALLAVPDSPAIATRLAALDRILRREMAKAFPGTDALTLDALDAVLSWDTWNRLRSAQSCSVARARRAVHRLVSVLLEGSTP